jgi:penicillin amidase
VAGDDDTYDWKGYVPFDELPSVLDPPSGILATANGRITPDGYPRVLATQWDSPFRTERIYRLLEQGGKIDVADMLRIQTDTWSGHDLFLAQAFARALDGMPSASARAKEAGALLKQWDGFLNTDAVAPSIVAAARRQLMRLILEPRLGNSWTTYRWFKSSIWLENTLRNRLPQWLPGKYVNYDELLAAALEEALRDRSAPERLADWRWGRQSPVVIEHPIFSRIPVLQRWAAPGLQEQSGGARTVKQVGRNFGPSERMTVDLADLDRSTLNVVTGQSGHLLSPHYMDQWALWYEGRTVTLPFSSAAVAQARAHELTLVPEGTAESR